MAQSGGADPETHRRMCGGTGARLRKHDSSQKSSRNAYLIARVKRILRRTVWALQESGEEARKFEPGGFEVSLPWRNI